MVRVVGVVGGGASRARWGCGVLARASGGVFTSEGVSRYVVLHAHSGPLVGNRKAGLGWICFLRIGTFYGMFSITAPEFLVFATNLKAGFLSTYSFS